MRILEVQGLVKTYGRRRVVDGVDLHVERGEIVGLLGPNGAGKTTCFRMTCGMIEPDKGKVMLNGVDVTSWAMYRRAREGGMGYLAQEPSVFRNLTVEQNLLGMMELLGINGKQRHTRCDTLLEQFQISGLRKSYAARLSGGERRRLEIARCLISEPEIVMFDEPFAGVDPVTVQSVQKIIRDLRDHGISVLITDHAAREILEVTDRCYVIFQGRVLCCDTPDKIRQHPEVKRIYLGDNMDLPVAAPPPHSSPRLRGARPQRVSIHEQDTLDEVL